MLIKSRPSWTISETEATPEDVYINRRDWLRAAGFAGLAPDSKFGPNGTNGSDGGTGTLSTKAIGGAGGQGANAGGDSSEVDNTSTKASNGSTDSSGTGSGGAGGSNGYAIITNQSSLPTINNNLPIPSGPNNEGIVVGRKITSTQPNTV